MKKSFTYTLAGNSIICANPNARIVGTSIVVDGKATPLTALEGALFIIIESVLMMPRDVVEPRLEQLIKQGANYNKGFGESVRDQRPTTELLISRLVSYGAIREIVWDDDESVAQIIDLYENERIEPVFKNQKAAEKTIRNAKNIGINPDDVVAYIDNTGCSDSADSVVAFFKATMLVMLATASTKSLQALGASCDISATQIARILILLYLDNQVEFCNIESAGE